MDRSKALRIGEVMHFDGVGMLARGDVLTVLYGMDASVPRARWLYARVDEFLARTDGNILILLVIASNSKPPDQATRAEDAAGYARLLPRLRRMVAVPEGSGFRASVVRLVVGAYLTITGKAALTVATNVEEGIARLHELKSARTPSIAELAADVSKLRATLGMAEPVRVSQRAAP
jgi:hypothetical protein